MRGPGPACRAKQGIAHRSGCEPETDSLLVELTLGAKSGSLTRWGSAGYVDPVSSSPSHAIEALPQPRSRDPALESLDQL